MNLGLRLDLGAISRLSADHTQARSESEPPVPASLTVPPKGAQAVQPVFPMLPPGSRALMPARSLDAGHLPTSEETGNWLWRDPSETEFNAHSKKATSWDWPADPKKIAPF